MCPMLPSLRALAILERTRLRRLLKDPASRCSENREDVWAIIPEAELRSAGQTGRLPLRERPHVLPDILTANAVRP
jgi:hypothetical protein